MLHCGLNEAVDGWGAMWQCAQRHGWDGQLKWTDLEGQACVWPAWNERLEEMCDAKVEEFELCRE